MFKLFSIICLIVFIGIANSTISNWELDNSQPQIQGDSLGYSYESDNDTTESVFFVETSETANGLDTSEDKFMFSIKIVDNSDYQEWYEQSGYMPDMNNNQGEFLFDPGEVYLPEGLYWIVLLDNDGYEVDSFRVEEMANPYRTISGTISVPQGLNVSFIKVNAYPEGGYKEYSAFTDSLGNYTINIDTSGVNDYTGEFSVSIETYDLEGYIPDSMYKSVDISNSNAQNVDFELIEVSSAISVYIESNQNALEGINFYLNDTINYDRVAYKETDSSGNGIALLNEGTYELCFDTEDFMPSMIAPKCSVVTLVENETLTVSIEAQQADEFIYGRLTVDDQAPAGKNYLAQLYSPSFGYSIDEVDENGYFALPASSLETEDCNVNIANWEGYDSIPDGYHIENYPVVSVGDSAYINLVQESEDGYIRGVVSYVDSLLRGQTIYVVLMDNDEQQVIKSTSADEQDSSYEFVSVPMGNYKIMAMIDTNIDQIPEAYGEYSSIIEIIGKDSVDNADITISDMEIGTASISGTITYSGIFDKTNIFVLLIDTDRNVKYVSPIDTLTMEYSLENIEPGDYYVAAVVDTNGDHVGEAYGTNDSLIIITNDESYSSMDITLTDIVKGSMSISGTLISSEDLPDNARIRVFAIPVDTTLPDSQRISKNVISAFAYNVIVDSISDYTIEDLPDDTVYYVAATVETLVYYSQDDSTYDEIGWGIYGEIVDSIENFTEIIINGSDVEDIDVELIFDNISIEKNKIKILPNSYTLGLPCPNPFNPSVRLMFGLPQESFVDISIYDVSGKLIKVLKKQSLSAGYHTVKWNGVDERGNNVSSGIYICRMRAKNYIEQKKLMLVR